MKKITSFLLLLLFWSANAWGGLACPDSKVLSGKLITDISWGTLFPLRVAGVPLGGGSVPEGAAPARPLCFCMDNLGVPQIGTQVGLYEPARLIDVTRVPYCAPSLGGAMLQNNPRGIGGPDNQSHDTASLTSYHFMYYAFPLLTILDMFVKPDCLTDGYMDMDLMYFSAVDPTWLDDELAFFMAPEAALFANPFALAACPADAIAAAAGRPLQKLYWCAGSWGHLYPFTGYISTASSPPRDSSLIATRAIASLHRRGLARKTMGDEAMCGSRFFPTIPKTQYKMSMFYPLAEVSSIENMGSDDEPESITIKGSHPIGQTPFLWGEWRNIPAVGEDFTYVLWRWNDCCMR